MKVLRTILWISIAAGIFLAFGWPALVARDPADATFEWLAKSTLAAFFIALAAILAIKARRGGAR